MPDFIEREAIIAHMKDLPTWWADAGGTYGKPMKYPDGMFDCDDVINSLESAPAANVAPVRHGRWEQCFEDWRKQIEGDKCSLCGFEHYGTSIRDYLYCPNCGAKMDEEVESE